MRFILLFLLLNFYNAQSQLVIDSIPTPFSSVNDIAYSENAIWVVTGGTPFIQKLDTSNGNILKTLTHSVDGPFGLTFDGTNLWVSGNISDSIFQIDTITGNTIASYPTPGAAPEHVLGLAWNKDSSKLYLGDSHVSNPVSPSDTLYVLDTLGNLLNQKKTTQLPGGLTYGANYLWVCDNFYDSIFWLDPNTLQIQGSFLAPNKLCNGLAWDGKFLWVSDDFSDQIYKVDVTGLVPCSPQANFSASVDSLGNLNIQNTSINADQYLWEFGNGDSDTNSGPNYQYQLPDTGDFQVCLSVFNQCGQDSSCQLVYVNLNIDSVPGYITETTPTEFHAFWVDPLNIQIDPSIKIESIEVYDFLGRSISFSRIPQNRIKLRNPSPLMIVISSNNMTFVKKMINNY